MIEPTFDMIFRALFVLGIVHIALFIIDAIKLMTTYKNMNRPYYWKHESAIAIPIKSLHELQNAYFITTKKELEVRL